MWHAGILVRALVHGWRHTCNAHIPFEGVGAALAIGLDSSGSPGALSVPCAHSSGRAALVEPLRCSRLSCLYNLAVAAADQLRCAGRSRAAAVAAASASELVCGHHSKIV